MDATPPGTGVALGVVYLLGAYVLGSMPTGVVLARVLGRADPRSSGSGNTGATNVARTLGWRLGALTLLGDLAKGLLPVLIGRWADLGTAWISLAAVLAVIGHVYSVFLAFDGGKGVATGLGAFLGLAPLATGIAVGVFAVVVASTRLVSLASISAALVVPIAAAVDPATRGVAPAAAAVAGLIVVRHKENIGRLLRREEPRFGR